MSKKFSFGNMEAEDAKSVKNEVNIKAKDGELPSEEFNAGNVKVKRIDGDVENKVSVDLEGMDGKSSRIIKIILAAVVAIAAYYFTKTAPAAEQTERPAMEQIENINTYESIDSL